LAGQGKRNRRKYGARLVLVQSKWKVVLAVGWGGPCRREIKMDCAASKIKARSEGRGGGRPERSVTFILRGSAPERAEMLATKIQNF